MADGQRPGRRASPARWPAGIWPCGNTGRGAWPRSPGRAIEIAERGFAVSPTFSAINKDEYERLLKNAGEGSCYLNEGLPYEPGDRLPNPELAATLRRIADKGHRRILHGRDRPQDRRRRPGAQGGIMTLDDLAAYRAVEVAPLEGTYQDTAIFTAPPPASGGLHVIELLNIAENWPLRNGARIPPAVIHHLSEALRFVFADRDRYVGDPDFVSIPVDGLLSKDYAAAHRRPHPARPARGVYPFGEFAPKTGDAANTTHLCVIDEDGNIVALTQSINDFFGTGIVPEGTGFLLNDHMDDFASDPESPNAPRPGRRPVSSMGPLIMFRDGAAVPGPRLAGRDAHLLLAQPRSSST